MVKSIALQLHAPEDHHLHVAQHAREEYRRVHPSRLTGVPAESIDGVVEEATFHDTLQAHFNRLQ